MNDQPDDPLEQLLRSGLRRHAADAPDNPDPTGVGVRAARYRRRRMIEGAGLAATALVVAAALVFAVGSSPGSTTPHQAISTAPHGPNTGPVTGSLVLPLTGTVQAEGIEFANGHDGLVPTTLGGGSSDGGTGYKTSSPPSGLSSNSGGGASGDQSVDVPPGTAQTLDRLSTHVSPDGVIVSTFYAPEAEVQPGYQPSGGSVAVTGSPPNVGASGTAASGTAASGPGGSGSSASSRGNTSSGGNTTGTASPPLVSSPVVSNPVVSSPVPTPGPLPIPVGSCSPTGELTLEMSDTQAVATFTEPFYGGYTDPLIDVEIGEFGVTEQRPATWVEAQVGPRATEVLVHFADGAVDSTSPSKGVAVLAHVGAASTTLGNGTSAYLEVLGARGKVLAKYSIGVGAPSSGSSPGGAPTLPPTVRAVPGASQPASPVAARNAVGRTLETALSCSEPPVAQAQAVYGGGAYEELGGAGSAGLATGDRIAVGSVVFSSSRTAVVSYRVDAPGVSAPTTLHADATLVHGAWLLSLGSVAPGLQVAPANQDGDVAVASGGPLFVHTGAGGVAIAVYRAASSGATGSSSGCDGQACVGTPDAQCAETGGTVEEVTTPGAVGIESGPLFGNYSTPLISVGLTIVGEPEGAPATVVGAEVGHGVADVELTVGGHAESLTPVDGVVDAVLSGAPSRAIGSKGGSIVAVDGSGAKLAGVPLVVDTSEPAPASSLPRSLPASGTPPSDPAAATAEIDNVFETVFSCANSPLVRSGDIQDNGMFANPLEQLYLGPYTNLVESVYATVNQVVFVDPTLADVSYTIRFHDDPTLTFGMIGTAVSVDGGWRVSYATLCAAVQLGGVSCSS
ncbi:MAG: hypothetical protein ACLP6E_02300 [Acidimicrobiales bacterium]